ncbi:MAG: HAD-IA family hydrolase [Verrucomicrobiaceae bacterium]|nr:HAD-IA family hydrolase [Verrucomicrobiaceae bacterium]
MAITTIFFDAAGTLIELAEPVGISYARIALQHGITCDPSALDKAFRSAWKATPPLPSTPGIPVVDDERGWWHTLVGKAFSIVLEQQIEPERFERLFEALYQHFAKAEAWRVPADVLPALQVLHGRYRMAVLSNFDHRLHGILAGNGLASFFEHVILSSQCGAAKPHPYIFEHSLSLMGVSAGESLHVGDDPRLDEEPARLAGLHTYLVARPERNFSDLAEKVLPEAHSGLHRGSI